MAIFLFNAGDEETLLRVTHRDDGWSTVNGCPAGEQPGCPTGS
jgi:hypothetical protein